jgi:hypothetical protein
VSADDEYRRVVDELRGEDAGVTEAPMMGMPSPKAGGKLFAGFRDGALVVKVGRERAGALIDAAARSRSIPPGGTGR